MKAINFVLAASLLAALSAPAVAAHRDANEKGAYAQKSDTRGDRAFTVARNGVDDRNHDEFDDHGGR